jgi:predicted membrane metal-binding protein
MDIGFLLSVFSVMGIFTYYGTFKEWSNVAIRKVGLGKRRKEDGKILYALDRGATKCFRGVAESASISISANLYTFPLIGNFFGSMPVLFVLSNIVILPYVMFIFIILLIITLFCQITTLWGGVGIMEYLLLPLRSWTGFIGSISWANIDLPLSAFFIVAWLVSATLSSKFIFINKKVKIGLVMLWLALFVTIVVLCLI